MKAFSTRVMWLSLLLATAAPAEVVYETTSAYHFIRVVDAGGFRTLSFDGSSETRMSLRNPLRGHFEYTEYFHVPWLWNTQLTRVLMIGLGGASTQRSYQHYHPTVQVDTVELDPVVVRVARDFFHFKDSPQQRVHVADGRAFLRRTQTKFDLIILDAYTSSRYGSSLPYHLTTREFFALTHDHLTTNGVLAYNVIGSARGWQADIVGALCQTLKVVFPQVYLFPARESENTVLIATKATHKADLNSLRARAVMLTQSRRVTLPGFTERVLSFQADAPAHFEQCPVLTDDYAPVDNLLKPRSGAGRSGRSAR